ncbi:MAG: hypothetical protein HYY59_01320 [Candidatus Omnitrophica bacterium]|nr:hypothetical protein [Candidatus Omnitrophota bacterium]
MRDVARRWSLLIGLACVLGAGLSFAEATEETLAPGQDAAASYGPGELLVQLTPEAIEQLEEARAQGTLPAWLAPYARRVPARIFAQSPSGADPRGLSRWYRLELAPGQDVQAAVETFTHDTAHVEAAQPNYLIQLDESPPESAEGHAPGAHAPQVEQLPDVVGGQPAHHFSLRMRATDLDGDPLTLLTQGTRLPAGAQVRPLAIGPGHMELEVSWVPQASDVGTTQVDLALSDGTSAPVTTTTTFIVSAPPAEERARTEDPLAQTTPEIPRHREEQLLRTAQEPSSAPVIIPSAAVPLSHQAVSAPLADTVTPSDLTSASRSQSAQAPGPSIVPVLAPGQRPTGTSPSPSASGGAPQPVSAPPNTAPSAGGTISPATNPSPTLPRVFLDTIDSFNQWNNLNDLRGTITLTGMIFHERSITNVEFYADDAFVADVALQPTLSVGSASFRYSWDTTSVPAGAHTIEVRATDSEGNVGTASRTVTVANGLSVQRPKVQVFLLEDVSTCIVATECNSDHCVHFKQLGTNQVVKNFNEAGFLNKTRAQLEDPNSGLTRRQIESAYCVNLRLEPAQIEAIRQGAQAFKGLVRDYSQNRIDPDIQVIEIQNGWTALGTAVPRLWIPPGGAELATANYFARDVDFQFVVSAIKDPTRGVYFEAMGCDGSVRGATNHGIGYSWFPAGLNGDIVCANRWAFVHGLLHQLGDLLNKVSPPQDAGFRPYGRDARDYGEQLSCSTRFLSPLSYFPDADMGRHDPDFEACQGPYEEVWARYCAAVERQGLDGEECNRRWDQHVLGVHFPPTYQIIGNSCRNGRQDVGETEVDRGGPCAIYDPPIVTDVAISPIQVVQGDEVTLTVEGSGFGTNPGPTTGLLELLPNADVFLQPHNTAQLHGTVEGHWRRTEWTDTRISFVIDPAVTRTWVPGNYRLGMRVIRNEHPSNVYLLPLTIQALALMRLRDVWSMPLSIIQGQGVTISLLGDSLGAAPGRVEILDATQQVFFSTSASMREPWKWDLLWNPNGTHISLYLYPSSTRSLQPGDHRLIFRVVRQQDGYQAEKETLVTVLPPGVNRAQYIGPSAPVTASLPARTQLSVPIRMRNTGSTTWTRAAGYQLGSQAPQDNQLWGVKRVDVPGPIFPHGEVDVTVPLTAPEDPGTYAFQWQMVQEGGEWFGDKVPAEPLMITVTGSLAPRLDRIEPEWLTVDRQATLTFTGEHFQPRAIIVYKRPADPDSAATPVPAAVLTVPQEGRQLALTWTPRTSGTYEVAVQNPDGGVSERRQVTVAAPAPPPDLTASVALTAPNPLPGSQVSVTALIHNRAPGPAAASTASVSFSGPGIGPEPLSFPVSPLEGQAGSPPQTRSFTLSQPGAYSVKVFPLSARTPTRGSSSSAAASRPHPPSSATRISPPPA